MTTQTSITPAFLGAVRLLVDAVFMRAQDAVHAQLSELGAAAAQVGHVVAWDDDADPVEPGEWHRARRNLAVIYEACNVLDTVMDGLTVRALDADDTEARLVRFLVREVRQERERLRAAVEQGDAQ